MAVLRKRPEDEAPSEVASDGEPLAILTSLAREGVANAAVALGRALRVGVDPVQRARDSGDERAESLLPILLGDVGGGPADRDD